VALGFAARTRTRWQPPGGTWRNFATRTVVLHIGLLLFGLALALGYRANLGLNAWGIFQIALTRYIPLTYGQVTILVGFAMLLVSWLSGVTPGFGTVCNMVFVGIWLDFFSARLPQPKQLPLALLMLVAGVVLLGWSSAIYLKAGLGAGPRDSFMLAVMHWTHWRVGLARGVIEGTVFVVGGLLDHSQIGIGTLAFTFGIGPVLEWAFRVLKVRPAAKTHAVEEPAEPVTRIIGAAE
jgi:uncharacterized protein